MSSEKLLIVIALFLGACVSKSDEYRNITVKEVDLDRFMGKWFVIASIPTWFETTACNAIETYTKNDDGSIHVDFSYHDKKPFGKLKKMTQTAYIVDHKTKAHWKIRPFWPFLFDYLVIDLDSENYEYTVIGRPNKANLWIMARKSQIPKNLYESLIRKVVSQGYNPEKIIKVQQQWVSQ